MKSKTLPTMNLTRLAAVVALAILAVFTSVTAASAHDELVSSNPKAGATLKQVPEELTLEFSGELQTMSGVNSTVVELSNDGKAVEAKAETKGKTVTVTLAKSLENGEYELEYRVVSSDGHPVESKLDFTVNASAKPTPSMISAPSESAQADQPSDAQQENDNPLQAAGSNVSPVIWVVIGVVILGGAIAVLAKFMRNNK